MSDRTRTAAAKRGTMERRATRREKRLVAALAPRPAFTVMDHPALTAMWVDDLDALVAEFEAAAL